MPQEVLKYFKLDIKNAKSRTKGWPGSEVYNIPYGGPIRKSNQQHERQDHQALQGHRSGGNMTHREKILLNIAMAVVREDVVCPSLYDMGVHGTLTEGTVRDLKSLLQ